MQSSDEQTFLPVQNTKKYTDVTQHTTHPSPLAGKAVAELEVGPHDDALMSLETVEKDNQPKGFCVAYNLDSTSADLATIAVTATTTANGRLQYSLRITNASSQSFFAEIRRL